MYVYGFGFPLTGFALFVDDALPAMGEPLAALCAGLGLVLGAEAARASAWSPRGVIREAGRMARISDIDRAADISLGPSRRA
jgi:hypothetical protein